jgi:transcription elongation factor Elf1
MVCDLCNLRRRAKTYHSTRVLGAVEVTPPRSALQAMEDLMVFDARCLDQETKCAFQALRTRDRPGKTRSNACVEHGCVSCHRKKTEYGAGGFCYRCLARITTRMRTCFREIDVGRDIPDEIFSISRKYNAAQRLFYE